MALHIAAVVTVALAWGAPTSKTPKESGAPSDITPTCWFALQQACPFSFGAACARCAASGKLTTCAPAEVTDYCGRAGLGKGMEYSHSVAQLSSGRRDIGATSIGPHAVFAGGCRNAGTGDDQYSCDQPDAAVDVLSAAKGGGVFLDKTLHVSDPRGWICASPAQSSGADAVAVLAGGGQSGTLPHSTAGDVVDLETGKITHYPAALSVGRWGIGCAAVGDRAYFAGGKVTVQGYTDAYTTGIVDTFTPGGGSDPTSGTWQPSPYNLSVPREATTAVNVGGSLLIAGGWKKAEGKYQGDNTVDLFINPVSGSPHTAFKLKSDAYDTGATVVGSDAVVVGNAYTYRYSASGQTSDPVALPPALAGVSSMNGGGLMPGSHVPQNGVTVGSFACFYGSTTNTTGFSSAVYCLDTVAGRWSRLPCTAAHRGGAIALVGAATIVVAGGFDPTKENAMPTDVVDVFDLTLAL